MHPAQFKFIDSSSLMEYQTLRALNGPFLICIPLRVSGSVINLLALVPIGIISVLLRCNFSPECFFILLEVFYGS